MLTDFTNSFTKNAMLINIYTNGITNTFTITFRSHIFSRDIINSFKSKDTSYVFIRDKTSCFMDCRIISVVGYGVLNLNFMMK